MGSPFRGWRSTLCGKVNAAGALANTSGALGASSAASGSAAEI